MMIPVKTITVFPLAQVGSSRILHLTLSFNCRKTRYCTLVIILTQFQDGLDKDFSFCFCFSTNPATCIYVTFSLDINCSVVLSTEFS